MLILQDRLVKYNSVSYFKLVVTFMVLHNICFQMFSFYLLKKVGYKLVNAKVKIQ